jgi:hypothetical protein
VKPVNTPVPIQQKTVTPLQVGVHYNINPTGECEKLYVEMGKNIVKSGMIAPIDNATKESLLSTRDMGKTATICVGVNGIIYTTNSHSAANERL